jgi:hypothetical protein
MEKHRLRVFENGCGGEYVDQRDMKQQEEGDNCIVRSFIICALHQI